MSSIRMTINKSLLWGFIHCREVFSKTETPHVLSTFRLLIMYANVAVTTTLRPYEGGRRRAHVVSPDLRQPEVQ